MSAGTLHAGTARRTDVDGDASLDVRRLRQRVCGDKPSYGPKGARAMAEHLREMGVWVSPYRCVFCHDWHVGRTPSMKTVEALARAIRGLEA